MAPLQSTRINFRLREQVCPGARSFLAQGATGPLVRLIRLDESELAEARALTALRHPGIASIVDVVTGPEPFAVCRWVEGQSVGDVAASCRTAAELQASLGSIESTLEADPEWVPVIRRAVRAQPNQRYGSARQMRCDLDRVIATRTADIDWDDWLTEQRRCGAPREPVRALAASAADR